MDNEWKDAPAPRAEAVMADLIAAQTEIEILRDHKRVLREALAELSQDLIVAAVAAGRQIEEIFPVPHGIKLGESLRRARAVIQET